MHNVSSASVFAGDENGAGVGGKEKWKGLFCVLLSFSLALQERLSLMLLIYCADSIALVRCCNGRCQGAWQTAALSLHVCDCVCVCVWEKARQQIERVCAFQACRWDFWEIWRRQVFCLLSLSLFLSLARSLSPLGLCYANVEGCSGFIVIFHLASDER